MPFFGSATDGYYGYNNISQNGEDLAEKILLEMSYNFNEGQQTVRKNTKFKVDAQLSWTIDYIGPTTAVYNSKLDYFYIEEICPHPEAISQSIEKTKDLTKYYFEKVYNVNETFDSGSDQVQFNKNLQNDTLHEVISKAGFFR